MFEKLCFYCFFLTYSKLSFYIKYKYKKYKMSVFKVFNPILEIKANDTRDNTAHLWSTRSIDIALGAMSKGLKLKTSPFVENIISLRKPDIPFQNSDYETIELIRCSKDIVYFANNYIYVKTKFGRLLLKDVGGLRDYQIDMLQAYQYNRYNIVLSSRQIGKTVTTAIFMLWYSIFNYDKNTAILGNKGATGKQILDEVKSMYKTLPFFIKPGLVSWNVTNIHFDNNCKILTRATTEDSLQGLSIDCLYLDEFAYVRENLQRPFWSNVWPTISSMDNSKVIISSTPNGKNLFFELWDAAIKGKSELNPIRIDWFRVPNRDEKWRKKEISNIGEAAFKQQYELSFDITLDKLLNSETMQFINENLADYTPIADFYTFDNRFDKYLYIKNDTNIDFDNDYVYFSIDLAEGLGSDNSDEYDYSTITGFKLEYDSILNKVVFNQFLRFKCDTITVPEMAKYFSLIASKYNANHVKVMVEENTFGALFFYVIDNSDDIDIDSYIFVKFKRNEKDVTPKRGLRRNTDTKKLAVGMFKSLTENKILLINDVVTLVEVENFQEDSRGRFNAIVGHDDIVNSIVNGAFFIGSETVEYKSWVEDFKYETINYSQVSNRNKQTLNQNIEQMWLNAV